MENHITVTSHEKRKLTEEYKKLNLIRQGNQPDQKNKKTFKNNKVTSQSVAIFDKSDRLAVPEVSSSLKVNKGKLKSIISNKNSHKNNQSFEFDDKSFEDEEEQTQ